METNQDNKKIFLNSLTEFFLNHGFKHSKKTWWRKIETDILQLIEFQSSKSGDYFFINLGMYFENFRTPSKMPPKSEDWHLWVRFERLLKLSAPEWNEMSDLNQDIESKILLIKEKFKKNVFPVFDDLSTYLSLNEKITEVGDLSPFLVQNVTRAELVEHIRGKREMDARANQK